MPRNRHGYLKADALRQGLDDQWAKVIDGVRHEVSIAFDELQGGFVAQRVSLNLETGVREVHVWQTGQNLPLARDFFKREVAALRG